MEERRSNLRVSSEIAELCSDHSALYRLLHRIVRHINSAQPSLTGNSCWIQTDDEDHHVLFSNVSQSVRFVLRHEKD